MRAPLAVILVVLWMPLALLGLFSMSLPPAPAGLVAAGWAGLLAAVVLLIVEAVAKAGRRRRARRRRSGFCPRCPYDLTGNASGTCPECGTPITKGANP